MTTVRGTRSRHRLTATFAILLISAAACDDDNMGNPTVLREAPDGARWDWVCEDKQCTASATEDIELFPECGVGQEQGLVWVWSRFFKFCLGCRNPGGPTIFTSHFCRPLICDRDDDCPRFQSYRFECANDLCQSTDEEQWPREPLIQMYAETVCFAAFTRSETPDYWDPTAEGVYADVEAACPGEWDAECTGELPDYCWVP